VTAMRRLAVAIGLGAVLAIAAAWTVVAVLAERDRAGAVAALQQENGNLALALEEHTARTIRSIDQVLQFARFEYLDHGGKIDLDEMAAAGLIDHGIVNVVLVADATGRIVATSRAVEGSSIAERELFSAHRDGGEDRLIVSRSSVGKLTGKPSMPLSRRISRPDGSFAGVAMASLNPDYFASYYRKVDLGAHGIVTLVGADGFARARRASGVSSSDEDMGGSTLLKAQRGAPTGNLLSTGRLDGVRRYMSYRTVADYGLVVAIGRSADEALAPVFERRRDSFAIAAAITLIVAAFAVVLIAGLARRERTRREAQRNEARFRATFDQARVGMAHVDLAGRFVKVNDALCAIAGHPRGELLGQHFAEFKFPEDRAAGERERERLLADGESRDFEVRYRHRGGGALWLAASVSLVRDPDGRPDYFVALIQDVTAARDAQERIRHQATHDLLTDLPNRALFLDRLGHAIRAARRRDGRAALLFLDLDRFKQVNDTLGHAAGDALLREVAQRLAGAVRASDTAARVGGDEFAVVLSELAAASDATLVAGKILRAMAPPMYFDGRELAITLSIGIAVFPVDGGDADALVRSADEAMFEAKHAGRNTFRVHSAAAPATLTQAA